MDWSKLQKENPIIQSIGSDWERLCSRTCNEHRYHDYIKGHAGFFLVDGINSFFAISKLKLGSNMETDFAIPVENHSMGLFWELIEIKTPKAAPYSAKGTPSSSLVRAVQQVQDWKDWILDNRSTAMRIFQARRVRMCQNPNFKFTVIIGTRENSEKFLDKRNRFATSQNIEIRSFEYLTERFRRRVFFEQVWLLNGMWDKKHPREQSLLANPFFEAMTDSSWKALLKEPGVTYPHFTSKSYQQLLDYLTPNEPRYKEFIDWESKA
mgnify:CR=1 FL=1